MYDPNGFSIWEALFYVVGAAFAGSLGAVMMKQIEGVVAGSAIALIGVLNIALRRNQVMPLLLAIRNRAQ